MLKFKKESFFFISSLYIVEERISKTNNFKKQKYLAFPSKQVTQWKTALWILLAQPNYKAHDWKALHDTVREKRNGAESLAGEHRP